jgi:1-aminocyclopropane-1-carboxylate deaminase/D-cysteine desulfhydrase-like pyridoxal-dependent ACC family enzyme
MKPSNMDELIQKAQQLTPIEEYDSVLFKRDDLFMPFPNERINGGKVRQAINLIYHNLDLIRNEYNSKVATSCGIHSPQGMIVSRVAKAYNLGCFVGYGRVLPETLSENKFVKEIFRNNGTAKRIAKQGFDKVVTFHLRELRDEGQGKNFFIIKFGIDIDRNPVVNDCIANQVENLPDNLDNLVIPCGSGITSGAILRGIKKYGKKVKTIYVVHISGEERRNDIRKIEDSVPYIYVKGTGYRYGQPVKQTVAEKLELDCIYEAKAYDWMIKHIDSKKERTLFWCVGNANYYR